MTLLDDLKTLDVSQIIDARGSISQAIQSPDLENLLTNSVGQTALGGLGASIQSLQDGVQNPADLFAPLMGGLNELLGPLNIDGVPVGGYLQAVEDGAGLLANLFQGLDGDPAAFGQNMGMSLGGLLGNVNSLVSGYTQVGLDDLSQFRRLVDSVERGLPSDPQALAGLAAELLLPLPQSDLTALRDLTHQLGGAALQIRLPAGRTSGLVDALNAVATAAASGDAAAVNTALANLERTRDNTLSVLRTDLLAIFTQIGQLRVAEVLEPVTRISGAVRVAEQGVLQFYAEMRQELAQAREFIDQIDPAKLTEFINGMLDMLEEKARQLILDPVDALIARLEAWFRELLSQIPLRALRGELSQFILGIAQAIQDADLGRYGRMAREGIESIRTLVQSANLGDEVHAALQQVEQAINGVLDTVIGSLENISQEINNLAAQAQALLEKVVAAIASFKQVLDDLQSAVEGLGIEEAGQQVIDTLETLRQTAEELLSAAPLPDSLRPLVEQLVDTLKSVDFDVVFQPVSAAVNQLQLPDEINDTIKEALAEVKKVLDNLIPAELISSIEAEINSLLDKIRSFDPTELTGQLSEYVNQAAGFIEGLDPSSYIDQLSGPFKVITDAVDAVNPTTLLAPVISAYDQLLGSIPVPSPETVAQRTGQVVGAAGEQVAHTAASPITQLAPPGTVQLSEPGQTPSGTPQVPELGDLHPGDVIRMFGYLPAKLREALMALSAGPAGEVLAEIDSLGGQLAQDLRGLQAVLWAIDSRLNGDFDAALLPLADVQLKAQLAIQVNFEGGGLDVDAALGTVALAGPARLRLELADPFRLASERARGAAMGAGGANGAALERVADAIERCNLGDMVSSLDSFLAALDPEPLAVELDGLVADVLKKAADILPQLEDDLKAASGRLEGLINRMNPGVQAQRLLGALDVLREELDLLSPRRLAAELGEIHAAIRDDIMAYDPAVMAAEIRQVVQEAAAALRALDPAALLGDMNFLQAAVDRVEQAVPTQALQGVGESLAEVGQQLSELDLGGLIEAVNQLGGRLIEEFQAVIEAIRQEIVALLESIQYAGSGASASASVSIG